MSFLQHPIKLNGVQYDAQYFSTATPKGMFISSPFLKSIYLFLHSWYDKHTHITVQTSGTTSKPQSIELTKKTVIQAATKTCAIFKLSEKSTALLCLPVNYIAGKLMIVRALVSGMNLITAEPSREPFSNIRTPIDFAALTPMQLKNSLQIGRSFNFVKVILIGGAPLDNTTQDSLNRIESQIYQSYGMTETATHVALRLLNHTEIIHPYKAIPEVSFGIDKRNCLTINAPHVSKRIITTNDIVELVDEHHFYWKGRYDHVINTGAIKVFPEEIEHKIEATISFPFYITSIPDKLLGEKVVLVIEECNAQAYNTIKDNLYLSLDKFEKPKEIIKVKKIRFTESGKIIRDKLI